MYYRGYGDWPKVLLFWMSACSWQVLVAGADRTDIARTRQSMSLFASVIKSWGLQRAGGISPQGTRIIKGAGKCRGGTRFASQPSYWVHLLACFSSFSSVCATNSGRVPWNMPRPRTAQRSCSLTVLCDNIQSVQLQQHCWITYHHLILL
jgi:hypothetical protein